MRYDLMFTFLGLEVLVVGGIIYLNSKIDIPGWFFMIGIIMVVVMTIVTILLMFWSTHSVSKMTQKVYSSLSDQGFDCRMDEGHIVVRRNDRVQHIYIGATNNLRIHSILFRDFFSIEEDSEMSLEGRCVLANTANYHFSNNRIVVAPKSGFVCEYKSSIGNLDDFNAEFQYSWEGLIEPIAWMDERAHLTAVRYPLQEDDQTQEHKIGFQKKSL